VVGLLDPGPLPNSAVPITAIPIARLVRVMQTAINSGMPSPSGPARARRMHHVRLRGGLAR
jgi:hypothetical protein